MKQLIGTIAVEGIRLFAYHGVYEQERRDGNHFEVDIYLDANILRSAHTDALEDTLDYQKVYQIVVDEMQEPAQLLEHLAHRIARQISKQFPYIEALRIKVSKENPPGMEHCQRTYVALSFDREQLQEV